jgi:hypothetical protein
MEAAPLPLFPLHTVLFPGGPLALRIFEPRYLDMVRRCMKEHKSFGVVTIFEGAEAGAVARLATLGTCARIVDFDPLPDGLLGITCIGEERVRILRRWQQSGSVRVTPMWMRTSRMPAGSPIAGPRSCRCSRRTSWYCWSSMSPWSASPRSPPGQPGSPRLRMYSPRYLRRT